MKYEAAAWEDPITKNINLVLAKVDKDGDRYASTDFDCSTRRIEYDGVPMSPDEVDTYAPSNALVGLTLDEATVIQEALWDVLASVKRKTL